MTLNDFPTYQAVGVKLSVVKDINNNDRKLITMRLRNTANRFQKIHTENIFGQDEIYNELVPFVNVKNGGTLPDTVQEDFSNNPNCIFPHSTIVNYRFPVPCHIKQREGGLMKTASGDLAVTDHVAVLGMVDRIENDLPVWNSTFDPQANGARMFRNNYKAIEQDKEPEIEVQAPVDNTVPGGNPNPNNGQQNQDGQQNPPMQGQSQAQQGYQQGNQQGQGQQRANF